jgi:two-component system, OmpR family, alkaline phosphatase synthesis response regulator PhoP
MATRVVDSLDDSAQHWTKERTPRVLLVEDDVCIISSIQRNLRPYQIDLEVAFHGFQGVSEALSFEPDLVITDLQMPLASGEELMQCLAHIPRTRDVPIIVITGRPGATLSRRMKELGVVSVLAKPIPFETLLAEIGRRVCVERRLGKSASD